MTRAYADTYVIDKINDTSVPAGSAFNDDLYSYSGSSSSSGSTVTTYSNPTSITVGDSVDGKKLNWVKASDTLYICDRNLWNNISYNDLDALGYGETDNTVVTIDGQTFKVRLLTDDEWTSHVEPNSTNGSPYYWLYCYSWTSTASDSNRVLRGSYFSDIREYIIPSYGDVDSGFRPALELVTP